MDHSVILFCSFLNEKLSSHLALVRNVYAKIAMAHTIRIHFGISVLIDNRHIEHNVDKIDTSTRTHTYTFGLFLFYNFFISATVNWVA